MLRALIFDVDGTLAETEELHRQAFNAAFVEMGIGWHWDISTYARLLSVTGGKERIAAYAHETKTAHLDPRPVHNLKTAIYNRQLKQGGLSLRAGVAELIGRAGIHGLKLAIATTTSRINVENLLTVTLGPESQSSFAAIIAGEDVQRKKPDPEVYVSALRGLDVSAEEAVAFEDSRNGILAARGAGLRVIVTPGLYSAHDDMTGADYVLPSLEAAHLSSAGLDVLLWR